MVANSSTVNPVSVTVQPEKHDLILFNDLSVSTLEEIIFKEYYHETCMLFLCNFTDFFYKQQNKTLKLLIRLINHKCHNHK